MGFEYRLLQAVRRGPRPGAPRPGRPRPLPPLPYAERGGGRCGGGACGAGSQRHPHVAYTSALYTTRPATVQRDRTPADSADLPDAVDTVLQPRDSVRSPSDPVEIRARLIERPDELVGQDVHVPRATFYEDRLIELSDSLGEEIHVVEVEDASHETLLRSLARGEIHLTVAPENIAELKTSYYTNLTVQPVIGPAHDVSWAVRRERARAARRRSTSGSPRTRGSSSRPTSATSSIGRASPSGR
jgi:hypothetical protein